MEVALSAELQAKLARIAQPRGTNPQELVREAIERLVHYDDWFVRNVEKGLAQIERGNRSATRESTPDSANIWPVSGTGLDGASLNERSGERVMS